METRNRLDPPSRRMLENWIDCNKEELLEVGAERIAKMASRHLGKEITRGSVITACKAVGIVTKVKRDRANGDQLNTRYALSIAVHELISFIRSWDSTYPINDKLIRLDERLGKSYRHE